MSDPVKYGVDILRLQAFRLRRTVDHHDRQGQGAGGAVVRGLLDGLAGDGCDTVWLQVETDNTRALEWYERLGFSTRTRYRYRSLPFTSGSPQEASRSSRSELITSPCEGCSQHQARFRCSWAMLCSVRLLRQNSDSG